MDVKHITENYRLVPATVWYLEMHQTPAAVFVARPGTEFLETDKPLTAAAYRKMYYGVGEAWDWLDRMVMPEAELLSVINRDDTFHYRLHVNGQLAGMAEYVVTPAFTEVQYFGLLPAFVGKGWGLYFLNQVIDQAWRFGRPLVQLNTCSLDHPNALSVYQKAGFKIVREEVQERKTLR